MKQFQRLEFEKVEIVIIRNMNLGSLEFYPWIVEKSNCLGKIERSRFESCIFFILTLTE